MNFAKGNYSQLVAMLLKICSSLLLMLGIVKMSAIAVAEMMIAYSITVAPESSCRKSENTRMDHTFPCWPGERCGQG